MTRFVLALTLALLLGGCSKHQTGENRVAKPESVHNRDAVGEFVAMLEQGPNDRRIEALQELSQMGPAGAPAVPAIIEVMNRGTTIVDPVVINAQAALRSIGKPAIPALEDMIRNERGKYGLAKQIIEDIRNSETP